MLLISTLGGNMSLSVQPNLIPCPDRLQSASNTSSDQSTASILANKALFALNESLQIFEGAAGMLSLIGKLSKIALFAYSLPLGSAQSNELIKVSLCTCPNIPEMQFAVVTRDQVMTMHFPKTAPTKKECFGEDYFLSIDPNSCETSLLSQAELDQLLSKNSQPSDREL